MAFRKSSYSSREMFDGKHRFEHWYRDNTVYFITARCRDRFPAFASEAAKAIFWDRFFALHRLVRIHSLDYVAAGQSLSHHRLSQDRREPGLDDAENPWLDRNAGE
jgi:hypothetical protein